MRGQPVYDPWDSAGESFSTRPGQLRGHGASGARSLHRLTEDASRILWPVSRKLFLKTAERAHLINYGQVPTEIPYEELGSPTTDTSCLLAREKHDDLDNAFGVRHWGISLAPAWKTEVHSDRVNFRVSRRQVMVSFASMVAVQASHCRYHIVYGGVRRLLVGFPDVCDVFDLLALTLLVLMSQSARLLAPRPHIT